VKLSVVEPTRDNCGLAFLKKIIRLYFTIFGITYFKIHCYDKLHPLGDSLQFMGAQHSPSDHAATFAKCRSALSLLKHVKAGVIGVRDRAEGVLFVNMIFARQCEGEFLEYYLVANWLWRKSIMG
jgi:hypothetical protein